MANSLFSCHGGEDIDIDFKEVCEFGCKDAGEKKSDFCKDYSGELWLSILWRGQEQISSRIGGKGCGKAAADRLRGFSY